LPPFVPAGIFRRYAPIDEHTILTHVILPLLGENSNGRIFPAAEKSLLNFYTAGGIVAIGEYLV
jgi:hypothetical protein